MIYTLQQFSKLTNLDELNCKLFFTRILKKTKTEYQYSFDENDLKIFQSLRIENFSRTHNVKLIQEFFPKKFYVEDSGNIYYDKLGYLQKIIPYNGRRHHIKKDTSYLYVDEIVAKYFCENKHNYKYVVHINGNNLDDKASNLKYASQEEFDKYQQQLTQQYMQIMPKEKIRLGEFTNLTKISKKTAYWLWKNVFYTSTVLGKGAHQYFSQENVDYILKLKLENYSKHHNIKLIKGTTDSYIEDTGKIFSYKRNFLEERHFGLLNGYQYIALRINGERQEIRVHRLVAQYFLPPPKDKSFNMINHKDGNKSNNNVSNLEWTNASLNSIHAYQNGLNKTTKNMPMVKHPIDIYDKNKKLLYEFKTMQEANDILKIPCTTLRNLAKNKNFSLKFQIYVRDHNIPV